MSDIPPSIWKRPWRGPANVLAWFTVLIGACFVIISGIGVLLDPTDWRPQSFLLTLLASILLVVLGTAALWSIRWLCCWKNFLRFLFVVACLITLVFLAYAVENWRGKHAWQSYRREWEANGEKFDIAALIPPPVPDEKNFAMTPLLKPAMDFTQGPTGAVWRDTNGLARLEKISADLQIHRNTNDHLVLGNLDKGTFADIPACAEFYRGNTNYPQAAPTATPAEVILAALEKFDPELKELGAAAASHPYSRFPIQYSYEPAWGILLPHLARVKILTILTHVRATAELEAAQSGVGVPPAPPSDSIQRAFADLKLGLRLSDSIRDEPLLIDHLVRIATLAIDLQTLREGLLRHAWTEAQLTELETYLASLDLLAEYKLAMHGERAFTTEGLDFVRRAGFRSNAMDYLGTEDGAASSAPPLNPIPSGWFYQNMLTTSRIHQDFTFPAVDERARRIYPEVSENGIRAVERMRTGPYTIFAKMLLPALERAVRKSARMQTYADAACVACALERYRLANGKLPETLAALLPALMSRIPNDVIDGKPLRYRPKPDGGYLLYSVGWNQTDDGGEIVWLKDKNGSNEEMSRRNVDITEGDWVWQMAAREVSHRVAMP